MVLEIVRQPAAERRRARGIAPVLPQDAAQGPVRPDVPPLSGGQIQQGHVLLLPQGQIAGGDDDQPDALQARVLRSRVPAGDTAQSLTHAVRQQGVQRRHELLAGQAPLGAGGLRGDGQHRQTAAGGPVAEGGHQGGEAVLVEAELLPERVRQRTSVLSQQIQGVVRRHEAVMIRAGVAVKPVPVRQALRSAQQRRPLLIGEEIAMGKGDGPAVPLLSADTIAPRGKKSAVPGADPQDAPCVGSRTVHGIRQRAPGLQNGAQVPEAAVLRQRRRPGRKDRRPEGAEPGFSGVSGTLPVVQQQILTCHRVSPLPLSPPTPPVSGFVGAYCDRCRDIVIAIL